MGKYIDNKQFIQRKKLIKDWRTIKVKVNIHGKRHTEKYRILGSHVEPAIELGLLKRDIEGYTDYFDWKPIGRTKNLVGGIKNVEKTWEDDKYFYVQTLANTYSLPKYLRKRLPREDKILFAERTK